MSHSESENHSSDSETGRSLQQEGLNTTQAQNLVHSNMHPSSISAPSSPCLDTQSGTEARTTKVVVGTSRESTTTESDSRRIEQDMDPDSADTLMNQDSGRQIHETTSDQGTSSSAEQDIPPLETIHEVTSDQGTLSSGQHIARRLDGTSSSEHNIPYLENRQEITSDQETSSSIEHDIPSLDITYKVKSEDGASSKFDESKIKLRAKEVIGVKSTRTQTSKEQEKESQLEINPKLTIKARETAHSSPVEVTSSSSQTSEMPPSPEAPTRIRGAKAVTERDEHRTANSEATEENSGSNGAAVGVQESQAEANRRDTISLANIPTTIVERGLYFNYKRLLLLITERLLSGDVIKFKEWATSILSVDVTASVDGVFEDLDRRGVISAVNLEKLREFFEKILRFDLVHMIDCFIDGDYSCLGNTSEGTPRQNNQGSTPRVIDRSQRGTASSRTSLQSSVLTSGRHSLHSQARTSEVEESYVPLQSRRSDTSAVAPSNRRTELSRGTTHQPVRGQLVTNAPGSKNATSNGSTANRARLQVDMGSNGRKLSQLQRADSARNNNSKTHASNDDSDDDDDDSEWLCSHYKRRCLVKFDCCDKYWPCHRCHNNESKCGQKKLKSRDTKFLKCASCGREQQFSSQSQFCNNCHKRFAKYFCATCKHLTGTDDNPYHCEKCGKCRAHSDRSFHCDVCGVCLDVQLRGHRCRAGSVHDDRRNRLEDAFNGCQILPTMIPRVIDRFQRATASSRTSLQSSVLTSGRHSLHSQARLTSEVEESYVPPQSRRPDTSAVAPSNRRTEVSGGTVHQPVRGQLVTNAPGYYGEIPESLNGVDVGSIIQDFITDSLGGNG